MKSDTPYTERNRKLKRSHNYRQRFFEANPGWRGKYYICPYCGRIMWNKAKISVDHIYSVRRVQFTPHLRERFSALVDGVNDPSNLVACCKRCNSRKGKKGGLWVWRARHGAKFMPFVRATMQLAMIVAIVVLIVMLFGMMDDLKAIREVFEL